MPAASELANDLYPEMPSAVEPKVPALSDAQKAAILRAHIDEAVDAYRRGDYAAAFTTRYGTRSTRSSRAFFAGLLRGDFGALGGLGPRIFAFADDAGLQITRRLVDLGFQGQGEADGA